jgi:hypothetical protein
MTIIKLNLCLKFIPLPINILGPPSLLSNWGGGGRVKLSLQQAVEAHRIVRRRCSHIFQDNRITDGGEVVSLTRRPSFRPRKIPGTYFC